MVTTGTHTQQLLNSLYTNPDPQYDEYPELGLTPPIRAENPYGNAVMELPIISNVPMTNSVFEIPAGALGNIGGLNLEQITMQGLLASMQFANLKVAYARDPQALQLIRIAEASSKQQTAALKDAVETAVDGISTASKIQTDILSTQANNMKSLAKKSQDFSISDLAANIKPIGDEDE